MTIPSTYPLCRTSGTCIACDFKVQDEVVLLIDPPAGLRTRAFVLEPRHLDDPGYLAGLRPSVRAALVDSLGDRHG